MLCGRVVQSFGGAVALSPGVLLMNRLAADLQHLGDLLPAPPGTAGVIHVDALKSIGERAQGAYRSQATSGIGVGDRVGGWGCFFSHHVRLT